MIVVKIDVTKIDKSALFQGAKGTYLDLLLWETPDNQYGSDYVAKQSIPKERTDAGEKGPILGNGECKGSTPKINTGGQATAGGGGDDGGDDIGDLPF